MDKVLWEMNLAIGTMVHTVWPESELAVPRKHGRSPLTTEELDAD